MAKRIKGVKYIKDDTYLIDYQVGHRRFQSRIRANSPAEAKHKRDELIVELRRQLPESKSENGRLNTGFDEVWQKLDADLRSDGLCQKNLLRHKKTFWRMFREFLKLRFPHIESISQASLPFFAEYKSYYINDLKHNSKGGWRAELTCVKSMMRRLKKLGFCGKEIILDLADMKKPKSEKKNYPNIPDSKLKELLNYIKKDRPDYYYPIYFITRTGRRINETTLIQRKDVEWQGLNPVKLNIRAETTKMREDAPLEKLDEGLREAIKKVYRANSKRKTIYLFPNRLWRKCTPDRVREYLKETSEKKIGEGITPHYFRHRFLTETCKVNLPIVDIMHIAGIRDIKVVTKYYSHTTDEGRDRVLAATRI